MSSVISDLPNSTIVAILLSVSTWLMTVKLSRIYLIVVTFAIEAASAWKVLCTGKNFPEQMMEWLNVRPLKMSAG